MSPEPMVTPGQARDQARRRLASSQRRWTLEGWSPPVWTLPLRPPTEREVLAEPDGAKSWVRDWATAEPGLHAGVRLEWEDRTWRRVGAQRVPVRLSADAPEALAGYVGGAEARDQRVFAARVQRVRSLAAGTVPHDGSDPLSVALRRHADRLTSLADGEFDRLLAVTSWLRTHPVAGLRPRQLPIRGVDSKWFSTHRTVLTALHEAMATLAPSIEVARSDTDLALSGAIPATSTGGGLGIVDADPRVRLRILDPELRPAGLTDLQVPVDQAAALGWRPERVLIVENLETLLCLPDAPGVVAAWGRGFDTAVASLPWLRGVPISYWGDLDSHGFAILHLYRTHLPQIESVLMDENTLEAFTDLWVPEPKPFRGALNTLNPAESRTLERLRAEGDVRLEQERICWDYALDRLSSLQLPT